MANLSRTGVEGGGGQTGTLYSSPVVGLPREGGGVAESLASPQYYTVAKGVGPEGSSPYQL